MRLLFGRNKNCKLDKLKRRIYSHIGHNQTGERPFGQNESGRLKVESGGWSVVNFLVNFTRKRKVLVMSLGVERESLYNRMMMKGRGLSLNYLQ